MTTCCVFSTIRYFWDLCILGPDQVLLKVPHLLGSNLHSFRYQVKSLAMITVASPYDLHQSRLCSKAYWVCIWLPLWLAVWAQTTHLNFHLSQCPHVYNGPSSLVVISIKQVNVCEALEAYPKCVRWHSIWHYTFQGLRNISPWSSVPFVIKHNDALYYYKMIFSHFMQSWSYF